VPTLGLVVGACIIGTAPILVRLGDAGSAAIGFWRLVFALPLLWVLARRGGGGLGRPVRWAVAVGVAFALDLGFWHYGVANTGVAVSTVLVNLAPVIVTAVAWLVLGERPRGVFLVAVALAVGGAALLTLAEDARPIGPNPALGNALSLATAFWYAGYFLSVSAARRQAAASRVMWWATLTAAPLLGLAALALVEPLVPASRSGWLACAGLGVVHAAGQGAIAWALGRLPAATASVTVLVQPVVAAALGWVLFTEVLGPVQAAGAAVALGGVVLAQRAGRRRERPRLQGPDEAGMMRLSTPVPGNSLEEPCAIESPRSRPGSSRH
jgi:drug/metabolite transporter (DMT)-like permease